MRLPQITKSRLRASRTSALAGALALSGSAALAQGAEDFFKGKNVACQIYGGVSTTIKMPSATMLVKSE